LGIAAGSLKTLLLTTSALGFQTSPCRFSGKEKAVSKGEAKNGGGANHSAATISRPEKICQAKIKTIHRFHRFHRLRS
jgi:hypothetical protein